jgi:hypothetical protein
METAKLFNGLEIHSKVTTVEGAPAVVERKVPDAYTLELDIQARVPQAAHTLEQLATADPLIGTLLPGLKDELPTTKVSNFYHGLYQLKVEALNRGLARLDQIVSRHNFFDCNTILELQDLKTSRKALFDPKRYGRERRWFRRRPRFRCGWFDSKLSAVYQLSLA